MHPPTQTCTHTHTRTSIHMDMHRHACIHSSTQAHIDMHVHTHTHIHTQAHIHRYPCTQLAGYKDSGAHWSWGPQQVLSIWLYRRELVYQAPTMC